MKEAILIFLAGVWLGVVLMDVSNSVFDYIERLQSAKIGSTKKKK